MGQVQFDRDIGDFARGKRAARQDSEDTVAVHGRLKEKVVDSYQPADSAEYSDGEKKRKQRNVRQKAAGVEPNAG
jgi:hypothetical protein